MAPSRGAIWPLLASLAAGLVVAAVLGGCGTHAGHDERAAVEEAALAPFRDVARRDAAALCRDLTIASARRLAGGADSTAPEFAASCPSRMGRVLAAAEDAGTLDLVDSFGKTQRVVGVAITGDRAVARIVLYPGGQAHPTPLVRNASGKWQGRFGAIPKPPQRRSTR